MNTDNSSSVPESKLPTLKIGKHTPAYPLIQGGMGVRISVNRLASAVAREGGVGPIASVGLGFSSVHYNGKNYLDANKTALADEIKAARKAAPDGLIAVNCMVALTDYEDLCRTSAENGANILISGAGLPMSLPEYTHDFPEVALVPIVSSTKAARLIIKKWEKSHHRLPDAIVMEAPNMAGGHLGARKEDVYSPDFTLEHVIPELVEFLDKEAMVDIPVVAAGGIWSREDMLSAFGLGARGVQMGSRFVCTHECDAPDAFKQMYLNAKEGDVVLMDSPVGLPGRAIKNKFLEYIAAGPPPGHRCIVNCLKHCSFKTEKEGFCIAAALTAAHKGDVDGGLIFSGSNAVLCNEIVHVSDIFDDLFGI